jgi:alpha-L-fucosidase
MVNEKPSRRQTLKMIGGTAAAALASCSGLAQAVTRGKFNDQRASLARYTIPDWFTDAKFGIWAHWGPQSAVGDGDWYARARTSMSTT